MRIPNASTSWPAESGAGRARRGTRGAGAARHDAPNVRAERSGHVARRILIAEDEKVLRESLASLLEDAEVVCHPYVIGELACGNLKNRKDILTLLQALPVAPVITQDEFMYFLQAHKLSGKGLGFVDVHLLASARLSRVPIWTEDGKLKDCARHLKLSYA